MLGKNLKDKCISNMFSKTNKMIKFLIGGRGPGISLIMGVVILFSEVEIENS